MITPCIEGHTVRNFKNLCQTNDVKQETTKGQIAYQFVNAIPVCTDTATVETK